MYLKNKIFTEKEREDMWLERLNKGIRYLNGEKYDTTTKKGLREFMSALQHAQKTSERLGNPANPWHKKKYRTTLEKIGTFKDE